MVNSKADELEGKTAMKLVQQIRIRRRRRFWQREKVKFHQKKKIKPNRRHKWKQKKMMKWREKG